MAENLPFHPLAHVECEDNLLTFSTAGGLTLRDWFAGQALAGLLALGSTEPTDDESDSFEAVSADAYQYADAMLAEREKGGAA